VPVPGDSEGFGIVHLEARAAGLPVVAADIEGIAESFVLEEDGLLAPAGDAPAFVAAIEYLLNAPSLVDDRPRRAARIAAQYDWSRIVTAYRAVFQDVRAR
jgi:glycosyltransferase involved in cell wall biosynthesis